MPLSHNEIEGAASTRKHADALKDLIAQLEGIGIAIPGVDEGQWAGTEGLSFARAYEALGATQSAEVVIADPAASPTANGSEAVDASAYPAHVTDRSNYAWRERQWRRPTVPEYETVVFEEPGRVLPGQHPGRGGTCCRAYYLVVSQRQPGGTPVLRVKHGGGERSWPLSWDRRVLDALALLDSDQRFRMLLTLSSAHEESYRAGEAETASRYEEAFMEGRLRKRKARGTKRMRVEILHPSVIAARRSSARAETEEAMNHAQP